jgi:hypothetical protein
VNAELVRNQEQPFSQEVADSMRDDAVALHLAEAQTACPAPAVGGLASECHNWSPSPGIHLIIDQMSQSLVVNGPDEDKILQSFTGIGVEHEFISIFLVTSAVHLLGLALHVERPKGS